MCGKLGNDEVESMQNMMSMAVYSVLADFFDVNIDDISPSSDLQNDLGMTASIQEQLGRAMMDMFDNLQLDFSQVKTVQDIVNQVVETQMIKTINQKAG